MNYKMMGRTLSQILMVEAAFMVPALIISIFYLEMNAVTGFALGIVLIALGSGSLHLLCGKESSPFYASEGLLCVGISWIVMSLFGCLPFYISGDIPNFLDAFFEIVSGFTTTGSSILPEVESLTHGMLYWRSFSHWLGGMGVLVFVLAISPAGGRNGYTMHLLRAESPGPNVGKLTPRMRQTTSILYWIYIILTVLDVIFLLIGGMPIFDAVCTAMGTAGTGGFGIKNDSIAGYSPYLQNVCTVFMLLFGVNFSCYYLLLIKQFKRVFKDEELRLYFGLVVASIAMIAVNIRSMYDTLEETIRLAAFQVASIITTTGFATADFDQWPNFSKAIIVCLMVVGACAGSTGGGFKVVRVLLLLKDLHRSIRKVLHPNTVQVIETNHQRVGEKTIQNTNAYLTAYVCIVIVSFLVVSLNGYSFTTSITAVLSCFNNIGPGLELVGPTCNFGFFSPLSKIVLIVDMLAGRLEIFPILILLSRSAWKQS